MDVLSIIGVIIGFAAIIGGNLMEGGGLSTLVNGPAAFIVIGGTLGAAILQTPKNSLRRALKILGWVFKPPYVPFKQGVNNISRWAAAARKDGLLGLESVSEREKDKFAKKGLQLLVDGNEPEVIRRVLETDMIVDEQRDLDAIKFYESMGGYAPTIGIIGAVMGLIHVMNNLADPSTLGPGIAVAFVATIYGVALANLLLIPIANKLRMCVNENSQYRELIIEGIIAIADGENPRSIEMKLNGYLHPH
ncbi:flagellar motor protein [Cellvibrio japonicus]|uniref:Transporter, MotA/TolQ/ExbB proton channel family n=1 Tax=Cellvibrio japonicus (strain Ueda107) TaxID=498211 RepID=B3PIJ6_CELJU|nr:flagellar motor protein [Cellvibrio japonicus]ACE82996.1 transporter, MotA/TolQ/ExbB proton channel family [Cellvibrio japonicus Ueda107]QEI12592.1 flagellar motor protein [Cellvibrio japonicus]QEI16166.1 flagellar motor protein [Cellvibrio japonicus]QEI19744.1 flagellar motor protein [Cellvibrio japonicus]